MTTVFSGSLAPNQSIAPAAVALTAPFKGVAVSLFVQMSGQDGAQMPEVAATYQVSIDGGTTYADPIDLGFEMPFSATGHEGVVDILVNQFATHVKFTLTNRDQQNTATVTLGLQQY